MVKSVEGTFPEFSDIFLPRKRMVPNTEAVDRGNQTEKSRCGEGDGAEARHGLFWRRAPRKVPCDIPVTGPRFLPCPSLVSPTPSRAAASVGPLPCNPALSVCLLPTFFCLEQNQASVQSHIYRLPPIWSDFTPSTSMDVYCGLLAPGLP